MRLPQAVGKVGQFGHVVDPGMHVVGVEQDDLGGFAGSSLGITGEDSQPEKGCQQDGKWIFHAGNFGKSTKLPREKIICAGKWLLKCPGFHVYQKKLPG